MTPDPPPDDPRPELAPRFPSLVTAAGISWVAAGGIFVASLLLDLALSVAADGWSGGVGQTVCRVGFVGAFAVFFLWAGVQTLRGAMRGLGLPAALSVALGLMNVGLGLFGCVQSLVQRDATAVLFCLTLGVFCGALGLGLIAAGWMAFSAGPQYRGWRRVVERDQYRRARREVSDQPPG